MNTFEDKNHLDVGQLELDILKRRTSAQAKNQQKHKKTKKSADEVTKGFCGCGCLILILLVLIPGFVSSKGGNVSPCLTEHKRESIIARDITDEDRLFLKECARFTREKKLQFIEFRNTQNFRENGFSDPVYKKWQSELIELHERLVEREFGAGIIEYAEVDVAMTELIWISDLSIIRKQNYQEREKHSFKVIDENLAPYFE